MDLLTGYVDIAQLIGVTSPDYRVFHLRQDRDDCLNRYYLYLFQMAYKRKIFYAFCQGTSQLGRWRLPPDEFNAFIVPLPPHDEQTAIADFLDRETAKIDGLIAEQERLIALLKEKRQAVISHAVTKGLDPNAPMRDSGVEWLGEVPAHWRISRLKHLSSHVVDCLHTTPTYEGDLIYPAIRTADLERGRLLLGQARLVSEEVYQERVQRLPPEPGDILYSREGELGMAALVPKDTKLCLGQRMMMFRTYPHVDSAYVMWLLNSDAVYQQVMSTVGGATSPHVNIADIVNFAIPLPPLHEQADIAHKIKEIASACDGLIEKSEEAISFLQERRSALISAAVTGKIDARPLAPASAEAA